FDPEPAVEAFAELPIAELPVAEEIVMPEPAAEIIELAPAIEESPVYSEPEPPVVEAVAEPEQHVSEMPVHQEAAPEEVHFVEPVQAEEVQLEAALPSALPEIKTVPLAEPAFTRADEAAIDPALLALPKDELDADLLPVFLEEGRDMFPQLGENLRAWQSNASNSGAAMQVLRLLHT